MALKILRLSMFKKLLFILLTLTISHSLVAMKLQSTPVEKAFREEFSIAPSRPFAQGIKAVLGSGLVAVGGYLLKRSLAGIQAIPTKLSVQAIKHSARALKDQFLHLDPTAKGLICGATAMTLCGLGLLAWVKPNQLYKNEEERKFDNLVTKSVGSKGKPYKYSIPINTDDYILNMNNHLSVAMACKNKHRSANMSSYSGTQDLLDKLNVTYDTIKNQVTNISNQKKKHFYLGCFQQ